MNELQFIFNIEDFLQKQGLNENHATIINMLFGILVIILLAYFSGIITRKLLLTSIKRIAKKTATLWDDILIEKKVFHHLSHLAPAIILYISAGFVFKDFEKTAAIIQEGLSIYMVMLSAIIIDSGLRSANAIYLTLPASKDRPIKGYIQVGQIIVYSFGVILILSIIMGEKPTTLLAGIGAMAAVLILVFRDTILGFVASIQLSANNMLRIGDWITMNKYGADGTVFEITLNTVKVQNWDKTISTIPTYALVSESYNNWRGMEESGGRRIMRSINIDMKSVKFCTPEMLEKFKKIIYLKDYIEEKKSEIERYNEENKIDESIVVNGRRMTNLGTFRHYVEFYLKNHPMIHNDLTFLVRHLQPTDKGIPIQIYVFSKDQVWANYEGIQADIFDHIIAVIPEFELRIFQSPSGDDLRKLVEEKQ